MINYSQNVIDYSKTPVVKKAVVAQNKNISFQGDSSRFSNILTKKNILDLGMGVVLATVATAYIFNKEITKLEEKAYEFFDKNYKNNDNLEKILNELDEKTKVLDPLSIIIGDKNFIYLWLLSNNMEQRKEFLRATCYLKLANNSNPESAEEYLKKAKFYYHKVEELINTDKIPLMSNFFGNNFRGYLLDDKLKLANINNNLGNAYLNLSRLRERKDNLLKAVMCYKNGLINYDSTMNGRYKDLKKANLSNYTRYSLNQMTIRNNLAKSYGILSRIELINKRELRDADQLYNQNLKDSLILFALNFLPSTDPENSTKIIEYIENTKKLLDKSLSRRLLITTQENSFEEFNNQDQSFRASQQLDKEFRDYLLSNKVIKNLLACTNSSNKDLSQLTTENILETLIAKYPYLDQYKPINKQVHENLKEITQAYAINLNNLGCLNLEASRFCSDEYNKTDLIYNSIRTFMKCLRIYNMVNTPYENAKIRINMAKAYMSLAEIEPSSKLTNMLQMLSKKYDNESFSIYESLQKLGGNIDRETVLMKAKNLYTESISIFCSPKIPKDINGMDAISNYEHNTAYITDLREFASAYDMSLYPEEYAKAKIDLGIVYTELSLTNPANKRLILKALQSEIEALSIIQKNLFPEEYGKGLNNIGIIYQLLSHESGYYTDEILDDAMKLLESKQLLQTDQQVKSEVKNRDYFRAKSIELFRRCNSLYPKDIYPKGYFQSEINLAIAKRSSQEVYKRLQEKYHKYYNYEKEINYDYLSPKLNIKINNTVKSFNNDDIIKVIDHLAASDNPDNNYGYLYYRSTIPRYEEMDLLRFQDNIYLPTSTIFSKIRDAFSKNPIVQSIVQ